MMNHLFRIILVLCLAAMAVAALIISNNRASPRPVHETAVEEYVAYRRATGLPTLTIKQYAEARMPQNFRQDMSRRSFGNATYYLTGQRYQPYLAVSDWSFPITATRVSTLTQTGYGGGKPIPYPPNDLWCAQLSSSDPGAPKVVLAGLHQDIYNAEWIVHEVTDSATVLSNIGCEFPDQ
jgi:hypothetical protein